MYVHEARTPSFVALGSATLICCLPAALGLLMLGCAGGGGTAAGAGSGISSDDGNTGPMTCAVIEPIGQPRLNTPLPGTIAVAFSVSTCGSATTPPRPVTGLKTEQFVVKEDGKSVSATESAQQLVDRNLEAYVTIVMDNSPSVAETGALQDAVAAAKSYAKAVLANASTERKVQVQVMFFSKSLEVKQPFTSDSAAVLAALDLLLQDSGSSTTNLYGATVEAISSSRQAQQQRVEAMEGGVNTIGQVLIFTDGSDQAGKYTLEQARQAVKSTPDDVLMIAFAGDANNEIDPAVIKSLGKSGSAIATSAAALVTVFADLAARTTQLQQRIYILGYCSPKLAGWHEVTIELAGIPTQQSLEVSFNADSFDVRGASCSAAAFASACDDKDCGGLFCGGCWGDGACDANTLTCSCEEGTMCSADGDKWCQEGTCKASKCLTAHEATVDVDGAAQIACTAPGPLWGNRPDTPKDVYSIKTVADHNVVEDIQTKLMWQQGQSAILTTQADAIAHCDQLVYAGFKDWRLPTLHELASLYDFSASVDEPALDQEFFPGTKSGAYWSSTRAKTFEIPIAIGFYPPNFLGGDDGNAYARCVRGGRLPPKSDRFAFTSDNEVVADNWTGLEWQREHGATMSHTAAIGYCENLVLAGGGWRLPRARELHGLVDNASGAPAINKTAFPSVPPSSGFYWTSTKRPNLPKEALAVDFSPGTVYGYETGSALKVRCVRGQ